MKQSELTKPFMIEKNPYGFHSVYKNLSTTIIIFLILFVRGSTLDVRIWRP